MAEPECRVECLPEAECTNSNRDLDVEARGEKIVAGFLFFNEQTIYGAT